MPITIAYDNLVIEISQNYAEQSGGELELSCGTFNKSLTPRRTLENH